MVPYILLYISVWYRLHVGMAYTINILYILYTLIYILSQFEIAPRNMPGETPSKAMEIDIPAVPAAKVLYAGETLSCLDH